MSTASLQLPPGAHPEGVLGLRRRHLDADVVQDFLVQALFEVPGSQELAFPPRQGRGVHRKDHGDGGLFHPDAGQRPRVFGVGQGVADEGRGHPGHRGQVPGRHRVALQAVQALKVVKDAEVGLARQLPLLQEGHLLAPL